MASSDNDPKRCGNCRWFTPKRKREEQSLMLIPDAGYCDSTAPENLPDSFSRTIMIARLGTNCPCHERKEKSE